MMRKLLLTLTLFTILLVGNHTASAQGDNMTDVLAADGRYSLFLGAVNTANLAGTINNQGAITVFPPTDNAFYRLAANTRNDLLNNPNNARNMVLNHAFYGVINTSQIHQVNNIQMASGQNVVVTHPNGTIVLNGNATLISVHNASNGIAYGAEQVILPSNIAPTAPPATGGQPAGNTPAGQPPAGQTPAEPTYVTPQNYWVEQEGDFGEPSNNPAYTGDGRIDYANGMGNQFAGCRGMTWVLLGQGNGLVHVGADSSTNPFRGDRMCEEELPILCVRNTGATAPPELRFNWVAGELDATLPVKGHRLTSKQAGDTICAQQLRGAWRMASFHESANSWDYWANGSLPHSTRFWVNIEDQLGNPWNNVVLNPAAAPPPPRGLPILKPTDNPAYVPGPRMLQSEGVRWGRGACRGMTWVVQHQENGVVKVGADRTTNPYRGDTSCYNSHPVLCIKVEGYAAPPPMGNQNPAVNWSQGHVRMTGPVPGTALATRQQATRICQNSFGVGWRIAQFHDGTISNPGSGGWEFWAYGGLQKGFRMWVGIGNQRANPWDLFGPGIN